MNSVPRMIAIFFFAGLLFAGRQPLLAASATIAGKEKADSAAPKTVITGSQMNLLNKGDAVEFVGGVKVSRGNDFLSADKVLSEEKKGLLKAHGDVYLRRDVPEENIRWETWSQEGVYNTDESSGTLWNKTSRVRIRRSPMPSTSTAKADSFLEMKAQRVTFFEAENPQPSLVMEYPLISTTPVAASTDTFGGMEAQGDVYVYALEQSTSTVPKKTEIWSTEAFFESRKRQAVFWNRGEATIPKARQEEGKAVRKLQGKTLVYYIDGQRLVVQGRVSAEMWGPQNSSGTWKKEGR